MGRTGRDQSGVVEQSPTRLRVRTGLGGGPGVTRTRWESGGCQTDPGGDGRDEKRQVAPDPRWRGDPTGGSRGTPPRGDVSEVVERGRKGTRLGRENAGQALV